MVEQVPSREQWLQLMQMQVDPRPSGAQLQQFLQQIQGGPVAAPLAANVPVSFGRYQSTLSPQVIGQQNWGPNMPGVAGAEFMAGGPAPIEAPPVEQTPVSNRPLGSFGHAFPAIPPQLPQLQATAVPTGVPTGWSVSDQLPPTGPTQSPGTPELFKQLAQYLSAQPPSDTQVSVPTGVPTGMPGLVEQLPSMEQWKQLLQTDIQPPAPVPVVPTQVGQPPVVPPQATPVQQQTQPQPTNLDAINYALDEISKQYGPEAAGRARERTARALTQSGRGLPSDQTSGIDNIEKALAEIEQQYGPEVAQRARARTQQGLARSGRSLDAQPGVPTQPSGPGGQGEIRLPAEPQSTTPLPPGLPPEFVAAVQARDAEAQRGIQRVAGNPWLNGQQPTGPAPPGVQGQQSPSDLASLIEQAKRLKEPAPVMMPAGAGESVDQARETGRRIRVKLGLDGQGPTPNATLQDPEAIAALRDKYGLQDAGTLRNTNRKLGLEAFQNTKHKLTPEGQKRLEDNSAAKAAARVPIKVRQQARTRRAQGLDPAVDQLSAIERGDEGAQQALADADLVRKFGPAGVAMVEARKAGEAQRLAADVEREKIASQEKIATGKIKADEEAATAGIPTWQVSNPETTQLVSPEGLQAFQDVVNANPAQLDQLEQLRQTNPGKWVDEAFRLAESAGLSPQEVVAVVTDWAGGSDALGGMLTGQNTWLPWSDTGHPYADKYLPGWNASTFGDARTGTMNAMPGGTSNFFERDSATRSRIGGIADKKRKRVVVKP